MTLARDHAQGLPVQTGPREDARRPASPVGRLHRLLQHDPAPPGAGRAHPLQAYGARIRARPGAAGARDTHFRVRHDKVDTAGTVTLRHDSKLHHIGLGRAHKGKPVKLLVADLSPMSRAPQCPELDSNQRPTP